LLFELRRDKSNFAFQAWGFALRAATPQDDGTRRPGKHTQTGADPPTIALAASAIGCASGNFGEASANPQISRKFFSKAKKNT
jgi:hypothetical protein